MKRPCLDCGAPSTRPRCPLHTAEQGARRPPRLGRYRWGQLKTIAIRRQPWCSVCRSPGSDSNPLEPDHRIPLSRGGKNVMGNLDVLCRFHNRQKGNRDSEGIGASNL